MFEDLIKTSGDQNSLKRSLETFFFFLKLQFIILTKQSAASDSFCLYIEPATPPDGQRLAEPHQENIFYKDLDV